MLATQIRRHLPCVGWLRCVRKAHGNYRRLYHWNFAGSTVTFSTNAGNVRFGHNTPDHVRLSETSMHFSSLAKRLCTNTVSPRCWSCGVPAPSFFCPSCKLVQPSTRASYFEILNCEQTFALDTQRLQRTYLQLQRALHPDNFSQKTAKEQEYSADQSALVNKAYRTLQKPLTRGLYMLELKGMHLEEGTDMAADPALLMEVMEINESLDEAQSRDEVDTIGHSMRERLKDLTVEINTALNQGDLQSAKALLAEMKYFANIEEKVKEKLSELADRA